MICLGNGFGPCKKKLKGAFLRLFLKIVYVQGGIKLLYQDVVPGEIFSVPIGGVPLPKMGVKLICVYYDILEVRFTQDTRS